MEHDTGEPLPEPPGAPGAADIAEPAEVPATAYFAEPPGAPATADIAEPAEVPATADCAEPDKVPEMLDVLEPDEMPDPADAYEADEADEASENDARSAERRQATGEPRVDEALQRLDELAELPVSEHPAVFEHVHARLRDVLGELDTGTPAGAQGRQGS
jgi:hypothetical protein